jgi:hypothetical protein
MPRSCIRLVNGHRSSGDPWRSVGANDPVTWVATRAAERGAPSREAFSRRVNRRVVDRSPIWDDAQAADELRTDYAAARREPLSERLPRRRCFPAELPEADARPRPSRGPDVPAHRHFNDKRSERFPAEFGGELTALGDAFERG